MFRIQRAKRKNENGEPNYSRARMPSWIRDEFIASQFYDVYYDQWYRNSVDIAFAYEEDRFSDGKISPTSSSTSSRTGRKRQRVHNVNDGEFVLEDDEDDEEEESDNEYEHEYEDEHEHGARSSFSTKVKIEQLEGQIVSKKRKINKSFEERIEELKVFKEKYGNLNASMKDHRSLAAFCNNMRYARRHPGSGIKISDDRIKALDDLGFMWEKKGSYHLSPRKEASKRSMVSFQQRIEELKAYKEKNGHLNISYKTDKNLYAYCQNLRSSRRRGVGISLNEDKIKALDEIGFTWTAESKVKVKTDVNSRYSPGFNTRFEDLKAFKEKHGHLNVTRQDDKSLYAFCQNLRSSRRRGAGISLPEDRIKALDELGFVWQTEAKQRTNTLFQERIEQLKQFKEKHGHINVTKQDDKSLSQFCTNVRYSRRRESGIRLPEDRIKALDELGFVWQHEAKPRSHVTVAFQKRIEQLKQFKEKHGHVNVTKQDDKSLSQFCTNIRYSRRRGSGMTLSEDRIKALDELGFVWQTDAKSRSHITVAFQERIVQLKQFKEKHGHVNVTNQDDKRLHQFCTNIRSSRRRGSGMTLSEDRVKALDELGFVWQTDAKPRIYGTIDFQERIKQLKQFKEKHGHVNVTNQDDKNLHQFCTNMRSSRRRESGTVLPEDRIKALDELGFVWQTDAKPRSHVVVAFQERIKQLKQFKEKHGHVNVTNQDDKSLAAFCQNCKSSRRRGSGILLTEDRIKALDEVGFIWGKISTSPQPSIVTSSSAPLKNVGVKYSFQQRIEQLKKFKETHGHLKVSRKFDKSLSNFCNNMRYARRNPGVGMSISADRLKALDDIGFVWGYLGPSQKEQMGTKSNTLQVQDGASVIVPQHVTSGDIPENVQTSSGHLNALEGQKFVVEKIAEHIANDDAHTSNIQSRNTSQLQALQAQEDAVQKLSQHESSSGGAHSSNIQNSSVDLLKSVQVQNGATGKISQHAASHGSSQISKIQYKSVYQTKAAQIQKGVTEKILQYATNHTSTSPQAPYIQKIRINQVSAVQAQKGTVERSLQHFTNYNEKTQSNLGQVKVVQTQKGTEHFTTSGDQTPIAQSNVGQLKDAQKKKCAKENMLQHSTKASSHLSNDQRNVDQLKTLQMHKLTEEKRPPQAKNSNNQTLLIQSDADQLKARQGKISPKEIIRQHTTNGNLCTPNIHSNSCQFQALQGHERVAEKMPQKTSKASIQTPTFQTIIDQLKAGQVGKGMAGTIPPLTSGNGQAVNSQTNAGALNSLKLPEGAGILQHFTNNSAQSANIQSTDDPLKSAQEKKDSGKTTPHCISD